MRTHVNDTHNEVEVLRHHWTGISGDSSGRTTSLTVLIVLGDEHTADVELDIVPLLLCLEQVEWRAFGDEEHRLEFQLTLNREVLDREVVFPVIADRLVERRVLVRSDVGRVAARVSGKYALLEKAPYRVQIGFCLLSSSFSVVVSLTFLVFLVFLAASSSSTSSILDSPSLTSSSSSTSFSVSLVTTSWIG